MKHQPIALQHGADCACLPCSRQRATSRASRFRDLGTTCFAITVAIVAAILIPGRVLAQALGWSF